LSPHSSSRRHPVRAASIMTADKTVSLSRVIPTSSAIVRASATSARAAGSMGVSPTVPPRVGPFPTCTPG
jgi:hypothetical protein